MPIKKVTNFHATLYGIIFFSLAFGSLPIYIHAPDFYATQHHVSLTGIGVSLLILRLIDAIQDPFIGIVSDWYDNRRPVIFMIGFSLFAAGFWLCFHPLGDHKLIWFSLSIFLCTTGFSIAIINAQAVGALWPASKNDRTKITGFREAFTLLGLLVASIIPTIMSLNMPPEKAFHYFSIVFLISLIIGCILFSKWYKSVQWSPSKKQKKRLHLFTLSGWLKRFYCVYFFSNLASSIPAVLIIFFVRDHLKSEDLLGVFLLIYFLSGALGMPFWQSVSRKKGKLHAWMFGMTGAVISFVWCFALNAGDIYQYAVICLLSGLTLGADLCLPPSILADYIDEKKTKKNASGYFSAMTFLAKSSLALATGGMFLGLGISGYQPGASLESNFSLPIAYALIPSVLKITAVGLLLFFLPRLNKGVHDENRSYTDGTITDA